jgi:hypothetical protein
MRQSRTAVARRYMMAVFILLLFMMLEMYLFGSRWCRDAAAMT